ncbi:MAG: MobC family plasmid mobilization relaxosome protein [Acidobacteriota bacterium]|nr:MobC family plasmid mobilization relaxosome protein [Acidobacteriota bacterium]
MKVHATEHEARSIARKAARAHLSISSFLRESALRGRSNPSAVPVINLRSYGDLGRLANNINQLTKAVHQGQLPLGLLKTLTEILKAIDDLRRSLIGL